MIAVTPWPPAAQIEIRPRPEPFSASIFAREATIRPPVRRERVTCSQGRSVDIELASVDRSQCAVEAEAFLAVLVRLEGLQGCENHRSEGFVDLVVIEVLQGPDVAGQQRGIAYVGAMSNPSLPWT